MKRTYVIARFYTVTCSQCNENITERACEPTTRTEAEQCKRDHEEQHRWDERPELSAADRSAISWAAPLDLDAPPAARKMQGG